jgi:hypothetical protein
MALLLHYITVSSYSLNNDEFRSKYIEKVTRKDSRVGKTILKRIFGKINNVEESSE